MGIGFDPPDEITEHLAEEFGVRLRVLERRKGSDRLDPVEEILLRFELVEELFLDADRPVADHEQVDVLGIHAEGGVRLEDITGFRAPGGPFARGEDARDELRLHMLDIAGIVVAADDGSEGPGRLGLDFVPELLLFPGRLEDPYVVLVQGLEGIDRHFQGHGMLALLGEVYDDLVALDARDPSDAPGAVKHEVPGVEGDVLLEVGDGLVDVAP